VRIVAELPREALEAAVPFLHPAPSQSDEDLAAHWWGIICRRGGPETRLAEFAAAVRAEATLAERANVDAMRNAKDEDLRTLRAAKEAEIVALRAFAENVAQLSTDKLMRTMAQQTLAEMSGGVQATDPAVAMRAKTIDECAEFLRAEALREALVKAQAYVARYEEAHESNQALDVLIEIRAALEMSGGGK
jgi:hypothetical protein